MQAEHIDARAFTCSGHTCYADTARMARVRQTFLYHLLRDGIMVGGDALHKCHRAAEGVKLAFEDSLHQFRRRRQRTPTRALVGIRIHAGRLCHAAVHRKACVFLVVFGMFHSESKIANTPGAAKSLTIIYEYTPARVCLSYYDKSTEKECRKFLSFGSKDKLLP